MPAGDSPCICCPYNGLFAIPLVLAILGHIFFNIAAFGCITFEGSGGGIKFGYWSVEFNDECESYDEFFEDPEFDGAWKFGRAVTVIGSIISYVMVIMLLVNSCVRYPLAVFKTMGGCMVFLSILCFLLLVGLSSDSFINHEISAGGSLAIVGAFFWAGAGVSMFFCMKERSTIGGISRPRAAAQPTAVLPKYSAGTPSTQPTQPPVVATQGTVIEEVDIVENPNGTKTKTTTKTTNNPDGSKTVQKTVEDLM